MTTTIVFQGAETSLHCSDCSPLLHLSLAFRDSMNEYANATRKKLMAIALTMENRNQWPSNPATTMFLLPGPTRMSTSDPIVDFKLRATLAVRVTIDLSGLSNTITGRQHLCLRPPGWLHHTSSLPTIVPNLRS